MSLSVQFENEIRLRDSSNAVIYEQKQQEQQLEATNHQPVKKSRKTKTSINKRAKKYFQLELSSNQDLFINKSGKKHSTKEKSFQITYDHPHSHQAAEATISFGSSCTAEDLVQINNNNNNNNQQLSFFTSADNSIYFANTNSSELKEQISLNLNLNQVYPCYSTPVMVNHHHHHQHQQQQSYWDNLNNLVSDTTISYSPISGYSTQSLN